MKTVKRSVAALGLAVGLLAGFMSCMRGGKMQSITVSPSQAIIAEGYSHQFSATARFSDGTTVDWTTDADWSSADPDLLSVSTTSGSNGLATALSPTTVRVTITAKDGPNNLSADATIIITPFQLVSLDITPASEIISIATTTLQFAAIGTYKDGSTSRDLLPAVTDTEFAQFLIWTSSNTAVATISNTEGSIGLATAVAPGTTTITATDPATQTSASADLTVQ